jgi:hypothetical protein
LGHFIEVSPQARDGIPLLHAEEVMQVGGLRINDCREVIGPHGDVQMHVWVTEVDDAPPRPRRTRDAPRRRRGRDGDLLDPTPDANAGANGERRTDIPFPGSPTDPPLYGGEGDQQPPTAGGVTEGPFLDARSLRLTGRDQGGKNFEARIYGPGRPAEGEVDRAGWPGADSKVGLMHGVTDHLPQALSAYQKMLNQHYRR